VSEIDVSVRANTSAPRAAREALDRLEGQITTEMMEDARLLVSELITNCIRHAGLSDRARISVRAELSRDRLRIEVSDGGMGFEPQPLVADVDRTTGWGLYLVEQIANRWGVSEGPGSRVWFELDRAQRNGAS
jgi:anti-sigma regulatory factor (Ser/Thr protein kinase)